MTSNTNLTNSLLAGCEGSSNVYHHRHLDTSHVGMTVTILKLGSVNDDHGMGQKGHSQEAVLPVGGGHMMDTQMVHMETNGGTRTLN